MKEKKKWQAFGGKNPCPVCQHEDSWCGEHRYTHSIRCHRSDDLPGTEREINGRMYRACASQGAIRYDLKNRKPNDFNVRYTAEEEKIFDQEQLERMHDVYSVIQAGLTLEQEHVEFAQHQWGLDKNSCKALGMVSNDKKKINDLLKDLAKEKGIDYLKGIPGVIISNGARPYPVWTLHHKGILIPFLSQEMRIKSFQIRLTSRNVKPKYSSLYGAHKQVSGFGFYENDYLLPEKSLIVTEGMAKAYTGAQATFARYAIGVNGVHNIHSDDLVEKIIKRKLDNEISKVLLAPDRDHDPRIRKLVQKNTEWLANQLVARGITVLLGDWDDQYKGIDDAIRAQASITWKTHKMEDIRRRRSVKMLPFEKKYFINEYFKIHEDKELHTVDVETARDYLYALMEDTIYQPTFGSKVILVDAGVGKTSELRRNFLLNNKHHGRFLVLMRNHDIIDESYNKLPEDQKHRFYHMRGRDKDTCQQHVKARELGNRGHNVENSLCKTCMFKEVWCKTEGYFSQYEEATQAEYILWTHQALASVVHEMEDKDGNPEGVITERFGPIHKIIADEDITSNLMKTIVLDANTMSFYIREFEQLYSKLQSGNAENVQYQAELALKVLKALRESVEQIPSEKNLKSTDTVITKLLSKVPEDEVCTGLSYIIALSDSFGITEFERPTDTDVPQVGLNSLARAILNRYYPEYGIFLDEKYFTDENRKCELFIESGNLIVTEKYEGIVRFLSQMGAIVLDASAHKKLWCDITKNTIKPHFKEIRIKKNENVKMVLVTNVGLSMSEMRGEPFYRKAKTFIKAIQEKHGKTAKIGVLGIKGVIKDKLEKDFPGVVCGWYGKDHLASNKFEDVDVLIVMNYRENVDSNIIKYQTLTGKGISPQAIPIWEPSISGYWIPTYSTGDKDLDEAIRKSNTADLYQTIHRGRPVNRDENNPLTIYNLADPLLLWDDILPQVDEIWEYKNPNIPVERRTEIMFNKIHNLVDMVVEKTGTNFQKFKSYVLALTRQQREAIAEKIGRSERQLRRYFNDVRFWEFVKDYFEQGEQNEKEKPEKKKKTESLTSKLMKILNLYDTLREIDVETENYYSRDFVFG
ncbi:DUF3854 domain-containing protein [Alicyclobacillus tolerans]|uniref:DUF3854 domain-containing protein n=1 Tax=Alicyclobacillus tolerans TaxID=90970 RepID=UPI001F23D328|nr:DUF3854 domain-containing protein [Alicyclobacillus tolerans]MCF8564860.1 DUF3854 domain-containing protein [Alicyclobacillus tolerans]